MLTGMLARIITEAKNRASRIDDVFIFLRDDGFRYKDIGFPDLDYCSGNAPVLLPCCSKENAPVTLSITITRARRFVIIKIS